MADPLPQSAVDSRIQVILSDSDQAFLPKRSLAPDKDPVVLRAEYLAALDLIKLLTDIRFRCLVFVTVIAGVANYLPPAQGDAKVALALFGLLATLGITVYELRNSQLYEVAMDRAKRLEKRLFEIEEGPSESVNSGLFGERPPYVRGPVMTEEEKKKEEPAKERLMLFWCVPVKHDHGLALIYGSALGAWFYLLASGLLTLPAPPNWNPVSTGDPRVISAWFGAAACAASIWQFIHHDNRRLKNQRPTQSVAAANEAARRAGLT